MTCSRCGDKGLFRVRYHDQSPDDYGVCLCPAGQSLRIVTNTIGGRPGWAVWVVAAASRGIPLDRVSMAEELLEADELAVIPTAEPASPQQHSIADAMRTRRPRL